MTLSKRQILPPGLWVVATPIGNLQDLSERVREALGTADVILCEDTRRTRQLLQAAGIPSQAELWRFDQYSERNQMERSDFSSPLKLLAEGKNIALVSDAGTPAIADPGARFVGAVWDAGFRVTPISGPSSVTALLSVAGLSDGAFAFRGFFPRKNGARAEELKAALGCAAFVPQVVWFESPERIVESLQFLASQAPEQTRAFAAKELSKLYEKAFRGSLREVVAQVEEEITREGARGEWCLVLAWPKVERDLPLTSEPAPPGASGTWEAELEREIAEGGRVSDVVARICQAFDISRKPVYARALEFRDELRRKNETAKKNGKRG